MKNVKLTFAFECYSFVGCVTENSYFVFLELIRMKIKSNENNCIESLLNECLKVEFVF